MNAEDLNMRKRRVMPELDDICPVPTPLRAPEIRKIRLSEKVGRSEFARRLSVARSTVERWEAGTQRPGGIATKLLSVVQKHGLQILA
jgi:putative transcriptional regulator